MRPNTTAAAAALAPTYDGFYLRNSLSCTGTIPSPGPYDLTPDIIQSDTAIPDAQSALSTQQSWSQTYASEPAVGQANYYYVRGINGAATPINSQVSLYYAPAQLIMFPSSWKNNSLPTSKGLDAVNVQAQPGHIAVGDDAFLWKNTPAPANGGGYYGFVAQVNDARNSNPIPAVTSWLGMSSLLTQNLGFGFRNTCYVEGTAPTWLHRLTLDIPRSLQQPGQLMITFSSKGFTGTTVGLLADQFGSDQQPIMINPFTITQDGASTGIMLTAEPGFSTSFAVQYWNPSGTPPAPGSTLTISVDYIVPQDQLAHAVGAGLVNASRALYLQQVVNIGPTATAMLGSATFVVAGS
jgi:hypothetical protein